MKEPSLPLSQSQWYAIQTLSNQEGKVKTYIEKFVDIEELSDFVDEVLMPTEVVTEVKNGRKSTRVRKFYPGYIFVKMRLYDEHHKILHKVWHFIKNVQGVIGFPGGDKPVPLKKSEIDRIISQVKDAVGKEKPKVEYAVGEDVKITDGPFVSLTGRIDEIDPERGKLKVSVSIFGRFTPVELEYWQVERNQD